MSHSLRIVAADADPAMCRFYEDVFPRWDHQVCVVKGGQQLVELCHKLGPDLVVTEVATAEGPDGIQAAIQVCQKRPTPFILVSASHGAELLARAARAPVQAYLIKPLGEAALAAALALAVSRFDDLRRAEEEVRFLRQELEDRKVVERAKGAVMKRLGLGEEEAYLRLTSLSSTRNRKLVETARQVLSAEAVFHELDEMTPALADRGALKRNHVPPNGHTNGPGGVLPRRVRTLARPSESGGS